MARLKTRKGYNKRARSEHPGVTISTEKRDGKKIVALRWRDPAPEGRQGKRRKQVVTGSDDLPLSSREAAKPFAVKKSRELAKERAELAAGAKPVDRDANWVNLFEAHAKHLQAKGRATKTLADYRQSWPFLDSWRTRPARPIDLTVGSLESFVEHVRGYRNTRTGGDLSPHSIAAVARHVKALLNFGRRRLGCVRLDGESINEGLAVGTLQLMPIALPTSLLRAILDAARKSDDAHPGSQLFPLLAFLMLTGCRRGEAERLRWQPTKPQAAESWVDLQGGRVLIYGQKTRRQRFVPLNTRPALRQMLKAMKEATNTAGEPYVFGGKLALAIADKREGDPGDAIGKSMKLALAGVQKACPQHWKPKDLRSTCATYLANSSLGLNLYVVAGELGHDYAVLVKHYAGHMELPAKQAKATTVEGLLGIGDLVKSWTAAHTHKRGRLLRLKRAG